MTEYWQLRIQDARRDANHAPSDELRGIYEQLCDHYQSMADLSPLARHRHRSVPGVPCQVLPQERHLIVTDSQPC